MANSNSAKLFVLTGPVGAYYPTGFQPISLLADSTFIRAFPGGVGSYKMGCNYAPTILISKIAGEMGCQQVLWLYDRDEKLTEVGTMNIFIYWVNELGEHELITPPLKDGLILPGVTRDSLLTIARNWGEFQVTERYPTMEEVRRACAEQRVGHSPLSQKISNRTPGLVFGSQNTGCTSTGHQSRPHVIETLPLPRKSSHPPVPTWDQRWERAVGVWNVGPRGDKERNHHQLRGMVQIYAEHLVTFLRKTTEADRSSPHPSN